MFKILEKQVPATLKNHSNVKFYVLNIYFDLFSFFICSIKQNIE